jgi:competence protein ComEC
MRKILSYLQKYPEWFLLLGLAIISLLIWFAVFREEREDILKFVMLDVGQGDSLYIESPTGVKVIIDGGPNKNLLKEISNVLPWYDRRVDLIVVTNPDKDHYEGFIPLLDKYHVGAVLESGTLNDYPAYKIFSNKIDKKKIVKMVARKSQKIFIGGKAYLEILFPDRDVSGLSPNDGSIVMKLVYGQTSVMLEGDSTARIETYLENTISSTTLKSTILKVGHHGSRTSSIVGFVKAVSPSVAIISSGQNNSYNHPHKETLETFKNLNIPVYNTCNNGNLFFQLDEKQFIFKNKNPKRADAGCKID